MLTFFLFFQSFNHYRFVKNVVEDGHGCNLSPPQLLFWTEPFPYNAMFLDCICSLARCSMTQTCIDIVFPHDGIYWTARHTKKKKRNNFLKSIYFLFHFILFVSLFFWKSVKTWWRFYLFRHTQDFEVEEPLCISPSNCT